MEPYLSDSGAIKFEDAASFIKELSRVFGDSDELATAARDLEKLRQGNREFRRYYADFSRLVNVLGYNDVAQRHALERGLSTDLLEGLRYQITPVGETLGGYVGRLGDLGGSIRHSKADHQQTAPVASTTRGTRRQTPRPARKRC